MLKQAEIYMRNGSNRVVDHRSMQYERWNGWDKLSFIYHNAVFYLRSLGSWKCKFVLIKYLDTEQIPHKKFWEFTESLKHQGLRYLLHQVKYTTCITWHIIIFIVVLNVTHHQCTPLYFANVSKDMRSFSRGKSVLIRNWLAVQFHNC